MSENAGYFLEDACRLSDLEELCGQMTDPLDVPFAAKIEKKIPCYDAAVISEHLTNTNERNKIMAEWADVMLNGAGVVVLKGAYADTAAIDQATEIYNSIIAQEKAANSSNADHFASGSNDRVWNSLQKLCLAEPDVYLRYFGNTVIDAVCEAWLGPNYQITAQVNLVYPGGEAQRMHRDYHLGFQTAAISASYPAHVHELSPVLTLQGAIAHCDMPVESGPTKLLPFSQKYKPGYAAWRREDFQSYFEENFVQLPLAKGDAVFFNPAIFHAAGANTSADIHRMANLLQVGSAFGRTLEAIDREGMCRKLYPYAQAAYGTMDDRDLFAALAATAEGYSFPTNLDSDPPEGGLAPETQLALFERMLAEGATQPEFEAALSAQALRKKA